VRVFVAILAVVSGFFLALAVSTYWLQTTIFDTEYVVARAAPLPSNPAVSTAIGVAAAEAVAGSDLDELIAGALPDSIDFLAPTFTDLATGLVFDATKSFVESDAFAGVWALMVEATHARAMASLTDGEGRVPVTIDLDDAADIIAERLVAQGIIGSNPQVSLGEIILVQARSLAWLRPLVDVFETEPWVFPLIAVLTLGAAVLVGRDLLLPFQVAGFSVAGFMVLSTAGLTFGRSQAMGAADTLVDRAAIGAIWDAFATGYPPLAAVVGAVGLAVGITTWYLRRRSPQASSR
jgi:hypothetical protein